MRVYRQAAGRNNTMGQNLNVCDFYYSDNLLKFQKTASSSDFIQSFHDPGQGQITSEDKF